MFGPPQVVTTLVEKTCFMFLSRLLTTMLKGVLIILTLGLVYSVKDIQAGFLTGQQCTHRDVRFFTGCFDSFGFYSTSSLTPNVTALIPYCSAPGRANGDHCVNEFPETCPLAFLGSDAPTFRRRQQLTSRALDYMCSNIDVLENDIDCVEGQMTELRRCGEQGLMQHSTQLASINLNVTMKKLQDIMKSAGEISVRCFVDTLGNTCSSAVTELIGNFLYGMLVYPYEN
ncbi:uncharacterized protein LOC135475617 [Liolophura sinensis]|uniref:uncharacterized protein LOC135475617 n=1 Tax=Liolophura sinensis TaxID=3198878 RepID=UPI00315936E6